MSRRRFAGLRLIVPATLAVAPLAVLVGWGTPAAALTSSPTSIDFGQVLLGSTGSQTITETIDAGYTGEPMAQGGDIGVTADTCVGFVGPGTCSVTLTFTPSLVGTETGLLSFGENNATGNHAAQISYQGTGVGTFSASPTTVNFGNVPLGSTASQTITVAVDPGYTPSVQPLWSATYAPFGVIDDTCDGFTGPGTCTLTETYTPTSAGNASAELELLEAYVAEPQYEVGLSVNVTGTGVATPVPVVVTGSQTYGSSSATFSTTSTPPAGDSIGGTVECTSVGNPPETISPSLTAGTYTINGSSCSGLTLSGPTAANYSVSYSGGTFKVSKAPTTLVAAPVSMVGSLLSLSVTYSATLVVSGTIKAVPGQPVTFSDGSSATCTGTTNASGVATCTVSGLGLLAVMLSSSYGASYGGSADYLPSSATGTVSLL